MWGRDMDQYVAAVLAGVETSAWAEQRCRQDEAHHDDVQAISDAEWAQVQVRDRICAAEGSEISVQFRDGGRMRGICLRAGVDWLGVSDGWPYAIRVERVASFVGLPSALHVGNRSLQSWTALLRSVDGCVCVLTSAGQHLGSVTAVASDHLELDHTVTIAYAAIIWVRFPRSSHLLDRMGAW